MWRIGNEMRFRASIVCGKTIVATRWRVSTKLCCQLRKCRFSVIPWVGILWFRTVSVDGISQEAPRGQWITRIKAFYEVSGRSLVMNQVNTRTRQGDHRAHLVDGSCRFL